MHRLSDDERRRRIGRRHALSPGHRLDDPVAVTRAMTVLHATEPPTVHLAVAARTTGVSVADVEAALYDDRSLVKQLAMRRTLFVFPRDLLPAAWGSASARVAGTELKRLAGDVERAGVAADGVAWLEDAARAVVEHVAAQGAGGRALDARTLRLEVPVLQTPVGQGAGAWSQTAPVASRVLTLLGARGDLVRGRNGGHWRISRPQWTAMSDWLGSPAAPADEREGYAELVRRWLATFGPGTETDVVWWLGATKTAVRRALADVGAVEVALDDGATGFVLPEDTDETPDPGPWAALLPTLDPTVMGWKQRDFYLDPADVPFLFDTNGNAGTTAWVDGRVVGCWVQDADGTVRVVLRHDVGAEAAAALDAEAARLTTWLAGEVVGSVYASRLMKGERLP
ncbi:winged helix DNA-binding domain-containing protein [uncultured Nocardioides sp.]|uniref:winged helix DNA-binding domain-containing protein n=1 Tax=uncultured Nocardioides sp. TaxID=198441 RepID=UPI002616FF6B|nr:winged helix DNA-binding domain-containing protein [uncultured Nocardioides sp.]